MTYNVNHYYNPAIGRFISEDPIGLKGGLNLQKYVNSNPINFIDPTGYITDFNSFPGNEIPSHKYSEYDVTILDYIWWTTEGMIKSILNAATGSNKDCPCEKVFWDCMRDVFLPGFDDVLEGAALITGNFMQSKAWKHAAIKGLTVPLRSNIFRFWFKGGKGLAPIVAAGGLLFDVSECLYKEMQCLKKQ